MKYAVAGGAVAAAFGVLVALAQAHVIFVPYFTPAAIQVDGLQQTYALNGNATFTVTAKGYGSNCHMLQVEILREGERASYYRRADDCRFMEITHDRYDLTRSFNYGGETVLGEEGAYELRVQFEDLVDGTKASVTRPFRVEG